ncbi:MULTISPECIES: rod-binding protein [Sphingomonas]|uniref:rod-binding protein n=1 Tax=Sphingomonas TaxID=13687 RepID=UPI000835C141|nr:rod-binding protein [Sphingomonas sp. CCH10-B3]
MTAPVAPTLPATAVDTAAIGTDTRRLASRANLDKAGQAFEAVFTKMMLKSMRNTHLAEDLFSNKAMETFRDMQDDQVASAMANAKPMGIGKAVTEFLAKSDPALAKPIDNTPRAITPP